MNGDYYENPSYLIWWEKFDFKENRGKESFLAKLKHQYHVCQLREHDYSAQSQNEWKLLHKSKFVSFDGWTSIKRKRRERKMGDQLVRGEEFEKKAEKKLSGWGLFGSKYEDAADLFDKAANCFKLAKSCNALQTFSLYLFF